MQPPVTSFEKYCKLVIEFTSWYHARPGVKRRMTIRDLLAWTSFAASVLRKTALPAAVALMHGAHMVLLDGLGLGTGQSTRESERTRREAFEFLVSRLDAEEQDLLASCRQEADVAFLSGAQSEPGGGLQAGPFSIEQGPLPIKPGLFALDAPTSARNAMRLLRAMQVKKPILLEGSPGVGKTSLVLAVGAASGNHVVRINLSEQTDLMDLLGSDLPVEGGQGAEFAWSDGILLQVSSSPAPFLRGPLLAALRIAVPCTGKPEHVGCRL